MPADEPVAEVSADLPYELQSKMFDQLANVGVAGAGLVITLAGTLLQGKGLVWIAAVEFALAAVVAFHGQQHLIESLFRRTASQKRSRLATVIAIMLIGMGIGSLGAAVALEGTPASAPATR